MDSHRFINNGMEHGSNHHCLFDCAHHPPHIRLQRLHRKKETEKQETRKRIDFGNRQTATQNQGKDRRKPIERKANQGERVKEKEKDRGLSL